MPRNPDETKDRELKKIAASLDTRAQNIDYARERDKVVERALSDHYSELQSKYDRLLAETRGFFEEMSLDQRRRAAFARIAPFEKYAEQWLLSIGCTRKPFPAASYVGAEVFSLPDRLTDPDQIEQAKEFCFAWVEARMAEGLLSKDDDTSNELFWRSLTAAIEGYTPTLAKAALRSLEGARAGGKSRSTVKRDIEIVEQFELACAADPKMNLKRFGQSHSLPAKLRNYETLKKAVARGQKKRGGI